MKLGFIGCGNMAKAMISGILKGKLVDAQDVAAFDVYQSAVDAAQKEMGIKALASADDVVSFADIVVLAVKPQFYADVINGIKDKVGQNHVIVTIAPGQTLAKLQGMFGKPVKIVRAMPNTPALVGEGMSALCRSETVTEEELKTVRSLFDSFGKTETVAEYMMDAVVMLIEAMADAAVMGGLPRSAAYTFAAQAVLGSAKMVLETGKHPGELKDMVCSPAGTTIEAVKVLEKDGFRSALIEAMDACIKKSKSL